MGMTEKTTGKLYDLWSVFYDKTFGALVRSRQRRAIEQLHLKAGDRVLDLGVGTGMMLRHYPRDVHVVGMDLSEGMLGKALLKCRADGLTHCRLVRGDAMDPPFAEASFDHVVVSHTISVVSNPNRLLQWVSKLVKPGGRVVVLNHFQSTHPVIGWIEKVLNPMFMKIGWRSDLPFEPMLEGVDLNVQYMLKMRLVDIWRIVVLRHPDHIAPRRRPTTVDAAPLTATPAIAGTGR